MRKVLLTLASICFVISLYAQETSNFTIIDGTKLIWQKVYETNLSEQELLNTLINSGNFTDILSVDGKTTFNVNRAKVDYESAGYTRMDIPIYVSGNDLSCFVTVQVKEGRYRVTVERMSLVAHTTGGLYVEGESSPIETHAVKKGGYTNHFNKSPKVIYDKCLSDLFVIKEKTYINEDW